MASFAGLSSSPCSYQTILGNLQNSRKLLSCTLDLIDASSDTRIIAAHRFGDQLLVEMRKAKEDPTSEKIRSYIGASVQILDDAFQSWKFSSPELQQECETALACSLSRFELFFFEAENKENITIASLIHELAVLRTLFPKADEMSLKQQLLPTSLRDPETYCEFKRMTSNPTSLASLQNEIIEAFDESVTPCGPQSTEDLDEWINSLE